MCEYFLLVYVRRRSVPESTDRGITICHVCSNKDLFSTYVTAKENVLMAYRSTAAVLETETVVLILT